MDFIRIVQIAGTKSVCGNYLPPTTHTLKLFGEKFSKSQIYLVL